MGFGSFEKILQVLDILEDATTGLSFDEIYAKLDAPRSTLYRYLKALTNAGLIASLPNTGYTLGPRIAELDYKMRTQDLLVVASRPLMAELVQATPAVALLCRLYRNSVLCVHQESHPDAMRSNYERGRSRPLLQGAASRVILAYMPSRMIAKLFDEQSEQFKAAQLGESIADVKTVLRKIRQHGWESVEGQVTPGATGIAAPIFDAGGHIVGSLSLTLNRVGMERADVFRIAERVSACADQITEAICLDIEKAAPARPPSTEFSA
jgi:DNA-binding IclR family transcriptional regulator